MTISIGELPGAWAALVRRIATGGSPERVTTDDGDVVLVPASQWEDQDTTAYLLGNPVNADRLRAAVRAARLRHPGIITGPEDPAARELEF